MDELLELLAALSGNLADIDDAELAGHLARLAELVDEVSAGDVDATVLETLTSAADVAESVATELDCRATAEAERQTAAEAALARVRAAAAGDDADDAEGDPSTVDEVESTDETADEIESADETVDDEPVAVAASSSPRVTRVAARRPASTRPVPATPTGSMVASANVPGVAAGAPITPGQVLQALYDTAAAGRGVSGGGRASVVTASGHVDPSRDLRGLNADAAASRIGQAQADARRQGLVASGGLCTPGQVVHESPSAASTARPVRDQMLTRFVADRGVVSITPPVTFASTLAAVDPWDDVTGHTLDAAAAAKHVHTVTCGTAADHSVTAIPLIVKFGNLLQRFAPERLAGAMNVLEARHARRAEQFLLETLAGDAGTVAVTDAQLLGTSRDVLTTLDRAVAAILDRNRLDDGTRFVWGAPRSLRNQIRADLTRAGSGTIDERLAVADAAIAEFFATRGIDPVWLLDTEDGGTFAAQADGALAAWPTHPVSYLYRAGDWLFLDGGNLDLGVVRDATLNGTNDAQMFMETFEGVARHSNVETMRITHTTCPSGAAATNVDVTCA